MSDKGRLSSSRKEKGGVDRIKESMPDFANRPTTKATRPPLRMQVDPEMYTGELPKWDKMAGSMREMMESQSRKDGNPKTTRMRGFGNCAHTSDVASFGGDIIASVKR